MKKIPLFEERVKTTIGQEMEVFTGNYDDKKDKAVIISGTGPWGNPGDVLAKLSTNKFAYGSVTMDSYNKERKEKPTFHVTSYLDNLNINSLTNRISEKGVKILIDNGCKIEAATAVPNIDTDKLFIGLGSRKDKKSDGTAITMADNKDDARAIFIKKWGVSGSLKVKSLKSHINSGDSFWYDMEDALTSMHTNKQLPKKTGDFFELEWGN